LAHDEWVAIEREAELAYFILVCLITLTACVYASVGLGGGTAYLSVMSFWNSDPTILRPTAWALNIVASSTSFQAMLAIALICASLQMLFAKNKAEHRRSKNPPVLPSLLLGMAIGIISGLVGIGGGIVLGPVLIALGWADMKTLAPITSLYILLNSSGALVSFLFTGGNVDLSLTGVFCIAVLAGSFCGSRWGAEKASELVLRRIFGIVALAAGAKLACAYFGLIGG